MGNTEYFSLQTAQVSGTPTETAWAQVYILDSLSLIIILEKKDPPAGPATGGAGGQALANNIDLKVYGKQVFVRLKESYEKLEKKNLATLRTLLETVLKETTTVNVLTLVASMLVGRALYVFCQNGEVLIRRGTKAYPVLKGEKDTLSVASGLMEDGDVILLVSSDLKDALSSDLEAFLSTSDPQEIAEALLSAIHKLPGQERLVASLTKVSTSFLAPPKEEVLLPKPPPVLADNIQPRGGLQEMLPTRVARRASLLFSRGKGKRVLLTVFLLLAALFMVSLLLGINTQKLKESEALFGKTYKEALQKYEEGIALSDLNPALATKTLREGKDSIEKTLLRPPAGGPKEESKEKAKLLELGQKIDEGLLTTLRIKTQDVVPLFFDLTLIKDGAEGASMSFFEERVFILDKKNSALYSLLVSTKKGDLVSALLSGPIYEAIGTDSGFVLDEKGIERVVLRTKRREEIIKKDEEWGEIAAMAHFASNLYLLDKAHGSIYKYQSTQDGFGQRRNYLADDVRPDFTKAISMAIDGAIWVLFSDGRISKFVQGVPQSVTITGLDSELSLPEVIFTDDESEHLYILDRGAKRVVVAKKDGTYTSQYRWEGIKEVTDMVVSEKEKKILLLSGSKIYFIPLSF